MRYPAILLMCAALASCKHSERPAPVAPATPTEAATTSTAGQNITGKVMEYIDVSSYTYLRLKVGDKDVWAAVPKTPTEVGREVTVVNPIEMVDFESRTLNRTFPTIYFGTMNPEGDRRRP